ncbi:hypothetical protein [Bacillus sp. AK128]
MCLQKKIVKIDPLYPKAYFLSTCPTCPIGSIRYQFSLDLKHLEHWGECDTCHEQIELSTNEYIGKNELDRAI